MDLHDIERILCIIELIHKNAKVCHTFVTEMGQKSLIPSEKT